MTTNTQILEGFYEIIKTLDTPTAWRSVSFDPPSSGEWLEPTHFPNQPSQIGTRNDNTALKRGILQVMVGGRANQGVKGITTKADQVASLFKRGVIIAGNARVEREPDISPQPIADGTKLYMLVTIRYTE